VTDLDAELVEIEKDLKATKRETALAARNGPTTADLLPPEAAPRYDDLANAERFLSAFGEDLLYSAEAKNVNLLNNLLGDYASATTTASVMAGKQNAIPNDIARLKGKRFVIIPVTEENERLNAALVKALSAGDTVTARYLFGEYFDFPFTGKLWIATNHKPTITDHSKGMWDRMKMVPFTQTIAPDKVIKADDLMQQLLSEAPAILNWAVLGCRDYFELDGLDVPDVIRAEIDAYRREQDSIAQFIEERCQTYEQAKIQFENDYIIPADLRVFNSDLYKAYVRFCDENGEFKRTHRRLTQNMNERGFRQMNSGGRYWEGIRLIDPTGYEPFEVFAKCSRETQ
jgi:putative DNA primase/helicase